MDNIGFWNVRGLNIPHKHGDVRWLLNQHSLGLVGVLETRVKAGNFNNVFPLIIGVLQLIIIFTREVESRWCGFLQSLI